MTGSLADEIQSAPTPYAFSLPLGTPEEGVEGIRGTRTPAAYAIALLIDLAQRGEIDPWNVQVIEVIDRCLSELAAIDVIQPGFYEANLSRSGQAFLDASLLVLLKANTLERLENPQEDLPDGQDDLVESELEGWADSRLPLYLERQLRRRPSAQPPQNRRVTLPELIEQLRLVAAEMEKASARPRRHTSRANAQARQAMRAALELAQQENLSEMAGALEQFLAAYWPTLAQAQDGLELDQLLQLWSQAQQDESNALNSTETQNSLTADNPISADSNSPYTTSQRQLHDRVGIFWALLLLSAQSKVELVQEEFYQDLKIRAL